ncbi:MAG: hypothetical protein M8353_08010 [ANME-2 cluster archaeon]|nr:hypothetical protein [ANME-2 cluster archaeon]
MKHADVPGTQTQNSTVYEEIAPYSSTIKLIVTLGFGMLAISFSFAVFGHYFGLEKAPGEVLSSLLLVITIYSLGMWSFFNMKFRISTDGVEATMPPFRYRVPFSEMKEITIIDRIPWYIGWGLRFWGRRLAFVSMHKRAVVIEKKSGFFKRLILTTRDPDTFFNMTRQKMRGDNT